VQLEANHWPITLIVIILSGFADRKTRAVPL
jgi:hypothetical protein